MSLDKDSKKGICKAIGIVKEKLPNAQFLVSLVGYNADMIAYLSGNIRKNKIAIAQGDEVHIEMSDQDFTKGRIVYRSTIKNSVAYKKKR